MRKKGPIVFLHCCANSKSANLSPARKIIRANLNPSKVYNIWMIIRSGFYSFLASFVLFVQHFIVDFTISFPKNSLSLFCRWHREGGGKQIKWQMVTRGGRGVKKCLFCGDVIFEWPLLNLIFSSLATWWRHYFLLTSAFTWWRHQKSGKNGNRHCVWTKSRGEMVDPSVFSVLGNSLQKNTFRWPDRCQFCWRQHFFCSKSGIDVIWRHVTSRRYYDVKLGENVSLLHI